MSNDEMKEKLITVVEIFIQKLKTLENREKLVNMIDDFSKIERHEFIKRYSTLAKYVDEICGENSHFILFAILSKAQPDVDVLLEQINDAEIRDWLKALNTKYISLFEGCFPPFLNDWYRVLWTIKVDHTHGDIAFLETTILKRNKEEAFLDVPFPNMLILINHWLKQMCQTNAFNLLEDPECVAQLQKIKELVDNKLTPVKNGSPPNP